MAATGFTPISTYYSATTTNVPTAGNLVAGELAINTADGKLFYKDSSGVVQTIATKATAALPTTTTGSGAIVLATSPTVTTPIIATTLGVGGATPSASGAGITFPATQSASSDANTLDDYEEGTWTPTLVQTITNPTVTYTQQLGRYTKVGNIVNVIGRIGWTANSGGSGFFGIAGLPFTALNASSMFPNCTCFDSSNILFPALTTQFGTQINPNTTYMIFVFSGSNVNGINSSTCCGASGNVYFSGTYQAN